MMIEATLPLPPSANKSWTPERDDALRALYGTVPNIELSALFCCTVGAIRNRAWRLKITNNPTFTNDEIATVRAEYNVYADAGKLDDLSAKMGREKTSLCYLARKLGMTDQSRQRPYFSEPQSQRMKLRIKERGHNRGFLGNRHSKEAREIIGEKSLKAWASKTEDERAAMTDRQMKAKLAKHGTLAPAISRGSWKAAWREIGGKRNYYRSRWEANYARYLEWLKQQGQIKDWQHEPETFWFEKIKRGVRSYKPDFRVWEIDGSSRLHEIKGWMDARSRTTLARMKRYYPEEALIVIHSKEYYAIARSVSRLIEGWEADQPASTGRAI